MPNIQYTGRAPGDVAKIIQLVGLAFHHAFAFDHTFEAITAKELGEFVEEFDDRRDLFLVARVGGEFAGSIIVDGRRTIEDGAMIRWFNVALDFRGSGVGSSLFDAALDFSRGNYECAYLWTFAGLDVASSLYERRGFVVIDERMVDIGDRAVQEVIYRLTWQRPQRQAKSECKAVELIDSLKHMSGDIASDITMTGYFPGVIGEVAHLHALYYSKNWGLDVSFEVEVARELAEFVEDYLPGRDALFCARDGKRLVGAIAVDGRLRETEGTRLRWFIVSEERQGRGLGRRLFEKALAFCAGAGQRNLFLWTFEGLDAARTIYENAGFRLSEEKEIFLWGKTLTRQKFTLTLSNR